MRMLVMNPERFTEDEISAMGTTSGCVVYLAVTPEDARGLLATEGIEVAVYHAESFSDAVEIMHRPGQFPKTMVLLTISSHRAEHLPGSADDPGSHPLTLSGTNQIYTHQEET